MCAGQRGEFLPRRAILHAFNTSGGCVIVLAIMEPEIIPTLRDLYPDITDEELEEAEENLQGYLNVVLRIYERLQAEHTPLTHSDGTLR